MTARIDHLVTSGTFSLDGGTWDVDNNVWLLGDDRECIVFDAPHDAQAIAAAIGDRTCRAIVCTHGHDDHVNQAFALKELVDAPVWLHANDLELWHMTHEAAPDAILAAGQSFSIAGVGAQVLHTPGHSPGSCCIHVPELQVVFSGDTLFRGGPGATGRSFSSFDTIIASIREQLFTLPDETSVRTGHGDSTVIGEEKPNLDEWLSRGY